MIFLDGHAVLVVLLGCLCLEYLLGDPKTRYHPVALFGRWVGLVESKMWGNSRASGVLAWFMAISIPFVVVFAILYLSSLLNTYVHMMIQSVVLWLSLGWKSLVEHVQSASNTDNLAHARQRVGHIVGRETSTMNAQDIRRASMESLAENSSDSIIAPLFWFALFGVLGAWGYRMVNTLDAMWGYKNKRYQSFGWCAARVDDVLNIVPARLTALFILVQKPMVWSPMMVTQAKQHLSPNAGYPETSLAFVLGIQLGGPVQRAEGTEQRAWMGCAASTTAIETTHIEQGIRYVHRAVALMLSALIVLNL